MNVFVSSNSNSTFLKQHSMTSTLTQTIPSLLPPSKNFTTKTTNFFFGKHTPQNFIFQNHKFFSHSLTFLTLLLSTSSQLAILVTMIQLNNFISSLLIMIPLDLISFARKHSISMMIFFYLHTFPIMSQFFSKYDLNSRNSPFDDHSCSLDTSGVHKHYSIAQRNFVIAKLTFFNPKKQNKYFSTKHNINEKSSNALPKHVPPTDSSIPPPAAVVPPISSSSSNCKLQHLYKLLLLSY